MRSEADQRGGFGHNFAASTYGRASVMDYPAPWVDIKDGKLDLSNAYAAGIGEFDKFAVKYAYTQFAPGADENQELEKILEDGVAHGMLYIQDSDARPISSAHPLASLWDNGSDPVATLAHEMQVRKIGLEQFGLQSIPVGTPLSELELRLVPLYLHHRYQLIAAAKSIGGVNFTYAVRTPHGPNPPTVAQIVPAPKQREALRLIVETLSVDVLRIPERILALIPPPASGYGDATAEPFGRRTDPTFDPIGAAQIAADVTLTALLNAQRGARLIEQHGRDAVQRCRIGDRAAHLVGAARRRRLRAGHPGGRAESHDRAADGSRGRRRRVFTRARRRVRGAAPHQGDRGSRDDAACRRGARGHHTLSRGAQAHGPAGGAAR